MNREQNCGSVSSFIVLLEKICFLFFIFLFWRYVMRWWTWMISFFFLFIWIWLWLMWCWNHVYSLSVFFGKMFMWFEFPWPYAWNRGNALNRMGKQRRMMRIHAYINFRNERSLNIIVYVQEEVKWYSATEEKDTFQFIFRQLSSILMNY